MVRKNKECTVVAVTEEIQKTIGETVREYTAYLLENYCNGCIDRNSYDGVLYYLAEICGCSQVSGMQEQIDEAIGNILLTIRQEIYNKKWDNLLYLGSYTGLGNIAYSLRLLNEKGWKLAGFLHYIDNKMDEYYWLHIDLYYGKTSPFNYDCIYGLAGMLNYYLEYRTEEKDIINGILKYLIWLTSENEEGIKRFFVTELQEYQRRTTIIVPYVDLGMAHGIMGPMLSMEKAMKKGFNTEMVKAAVTSMYTMYKECGVLNNQGITIFPTQYAYVDYAQGRVVDYSFNNSWCYGNGSILFGLMKVAYVLGFDSDYRRYRTEFLALMQQSMGKYNLNEPIICHGYASAILLQLAGFYHTNDKGFLETLEENLKLVMQQHSRFLNRKEYAEEYCFLEGADGVMMSILKAIGENIHCSRLLFLE